MLLLLRRIVNQLTSTTCLNLSRRSTYIESENKLRTLCSSICANEKKISGGGGGVAPPPISISISKSISDDDDDVYSSVELALDSVVKIFTVSTTPNYSLPWQNKSQRESTGSG